jgi:hypothetical protein
MSPGSRLIKQADTVLLIYPMEWPMSQQVAPNTWTTGRGAPTLTDRR